MAEAGYSQPSTQKPRFARKKEFSLQDKYNDYTLSYYQHYCLPGINLNKSPWVEKWDLENVMDLINNYSYICDLPKPLLPPSRKTQCLLTNSDPATDLIFTKSIIQDDVDKILDNFQKHITEHKFVHKKDIQWTKHDDKREIILPRYIGDLSDILEMDPDPNFQGRYNWYHTGGCLTGLTLNNQPILIFPYMDELVAMPLDFKENSTWKPMFKNAAKWNLSDTIYEIRHTTTPFCRILARFKNECIFYSLKENNGKVNLIPLDAKSSDASLVSADLQQVDCTLYCTLDVNRKFVTGDLVYGKVVKEGEFSPSRQVPDNWGCLRYQTRNPDLITYADRCCIYYFDTRMSFTPVLSMCPKEYLESCENISFLMHSNQPSRLYIGAYHSLLMCDDRKPDDCVTQKWTHQLKSAPLQGSALMHGNEEIVVISGTMCTDKSIIINNWHECDNPHSFYQPRIPPSILDTLRESQFLGKCLDPLLTPRLNLSTVGVHLNAINDSVFIFSQNSIGDIFYQCITHDKYSERIPFINSYAHYALDRWERKIVSEDNPLMPLFLSDQFNMEKLAKNFSNKEAKYTPPVAKESFLPDYWKQPIEQLNSYVDLLAPELLSVWEVVNENGEAGSSSNQTQRVWNWLEMVSDEVGMKESQDQTEDQLEENFPFTPIDSQELVSVSQQYIEREAPTEVSEEQFNPDLIRHEIKSELENDVLPDDCYLPPVTVKKKPKQPPKRKSGFVDGF